MGAKPFVTDIENIRRRARQHIEKGAITAGYTADRQTVIKILNEALAAEIVCVLRYKYHYFKAYVIKAKPAATDLAEHAQDDTQQATQIHARLLTLGDQPSIHTPSHSSPSHPPP